MKKQENAYFTVEAAMVMPIVLFAIGMVIYLGFFQYSRCLAEQEEGLLQIQDNAAQQVLSPVDFIRMYHKVAGGR